MSRRKNKKKAGLLTRFGKNQAISTWVFLDCLDRFDFLVFRLFHQISVPVIGKDVAMRQATNQMNLVN